MPAFDDHLSLLVLYLALLLSACPAEEKPVEKLEICRMNLFLSVSPSDAASDASCSSSRMGAVDMDRP